MRISDWSSDVCSSDLPRHSPRTPGRGGTRLYVRRTIAAPQPSAFPYAQVQGSSGDRPSSPLIYKHGVHLRTMPLQMLAVQRSEEHTSELQSLMRISYAVFCLKKKKNTTFIVTQPLKEHTTTHIQPPTQY